MKITLNSNYNHSVQSTLPNNGNVKQEIDLKQLLIKNLSKGGNGKGQSVLWKKENDVEVSGVSVSALHDFLIEAEKLGKNIRFVKTTTIEILD